MDLKMLGGAPPLPKWFDVEAVSNPSTNETTVTVMLSSSSGATAIPFSTKIPRGVLTAADLVEAAKIQLHPIARGALSFVMLPPRVHITGEPAGPGKAKLRVTCRHAGKDYAFEKDVEFDQVRVSDLAEAIKFLRMVQSVGEV